MSAGMLALLDLLLGKLGPGWCFVLFAALALVSIPLLYLLQIRGMFWRQKRPGTATNNPAEETETGGQKIEVGQLEKRCSSPKVP